MRTRNGVRCLGLGWFALGLLASGAAHSQEPLEARPLIEITPGRARAFHAAVQRFAVEVSESAAGAAAAPDLDEFRADLERAIAYSNVVLPLQRNPTVSSMQPP